MSPRRPFSALALVALVCSAFAMAPVVSCTASVPEEEGFPDTGPAPRPRGTSTVGTDDDGGGPVVEDSGPGGDMACPSGRGSEMIAVGDLANGGFCIDAKETTGKDYEAFVAAVNPAMTQQPEACAWNTDFKSDDPETGDHPAHGMDWCDAYVYCQYLGKRLCGDRRGGATRGENTSEDQWYYACSHGMDGQHEYPYGNTYSRTACNTEKTTVGAASLETVGARTRCTGGYPGLKDMSGNAWEFTDACTAAAGADRSLDMCSARGSGPTGKEAARCTSIIRRARNFKYRDAGIRCCAR